MRFDKNEYVIKRLGDLETITITKEALEEWRDHYLEVAEGYNLDLIAQDDASTWRWGFYKGKADALTEILKHFEDEND